MPPLLLAARFLLLAATSLAAPAAADEKHYDLDACPKSLRCGDDVEVHYPFFPANTTYTINGSYCGYPGMAIACEAGRATLRLKEDNYTVLGIDYENHTVTVADKDVLTAGDCPRVTHNVTVPAETWLNLSTTANDNLAFFFGCAFTAATPLPPPIDPINCSSFPERDRVSYVAAQNDVPPQDTWPRACKEVIVVPVLKDLLFSSDEYLPCLNSDGYGKALKQGFQLTWDPSRGPCYLCEQSKGQCSYNQRGQFLGCLCSDGRVRDEECGNNDSSSFYYILLFHISLSFLAL